MNFGEGFVDIAACLFRSDERDGGRFFDGLEYQAKYLTCRHLHNEKRIMFLHLHSSYECSRNFIRSLRSSRFLAHIHSKRVADDPFIKSIQQ